MNSLSNDDLARQLRPQMTSSSKDDTPRPRLSVVPAAMQKAPVQPPPAPPQRMATPSLQEVARAAQPLTEAQIRSLFFALRRGTEVRAQRKPTAGELQQLVEAVNKARQLQALAAAALTGNFDVYWDGTDWAFESRAQSHADSIDLAA